MTKHYKINFPDFAKGLDVSHGEKNLEPGKNIESFNMRYVPEGGARTALGYAPLLSWNFGQSGPIDGMHSCEQYPGLAFVAVGGEIYMVYGETGTPYNVDTGLVLTPGVSVWFVEYRGTVYFSNGIEPMGKIAIGRLTADLTLTPPDQTTSVRTASYQWILSSQGTTEYRLEIAGGGQTDLSEPTSVIINGVTATKAAGGVTTLTAGTWAWGNSDNLGYYTIYVRLSDGTDPDTKALDFVQAVFADYLDLDEAEGYKFYSTFFGQSGTLSGSADKIFIEGDEIDYRGITAIGFGDRIYSLTNITATHAVGAFVTQYQALVNDLRPTFMTIFRGTMWVNDTNSPNTVFYSKTVSSLSTISNVSDFSDGENYMIGDGGQLTGLHAARDRIYVFTENKTFYITIQADPVTGQLVFSEDILFTPLYGVPNPYCIAEMEEVTIFFTGNRLIRIGFAPYTNQLIPDDSFDAPALPILQGANLNQEKAMLAYDSVKKVLFNTFKTKSGVYTSLVFDTHHKKYSYPDDHDPSCYLFYNNSMLFGSKETDEVMKMGSDLNTDGIEMIHRLRLGRTEYEKGRVTSKYVRGYVDGYKTRGSIINFIIYINDIMVGGIRHITDQHAKISGTGTPMGRDTTGVVTTGDGGGAELLYPFSYPFVVMAYGEDISASFSSLMDGAGWEISNMTIDAIAYGKVPYTHY